MSYITAVEYNSIMERPQAEATTARIKRASLLLDARIGNYYPDEDTGWKLDIDDLSIDQENAVKEWLSQMIAYLYDNNDIAPSTASLSLGRFSVTEYGQKGRVLPESLCFADSILVSSGLVKRGVTIK